MPDYSKLHDLVSHRVNFEFDTGARIVGYLSSCQPSSGPVEFCVVQKAELIDSAGRVVRKADELTLCPNVLVGVQTDEGPRGRDLR
ncbi:MAG: hypothetical protein H6709_03635 [Kofleriaceae bacterium]|nr:hypothetical protein [Myxococcales bacterium]MCB9563680.1 hypothetical protein [Kofleriaceae bacterium]MCB9571161.1 hypothetical protein [Kofleriaceae bacterium]